MAVYYVGYHPTAFTKTKSVVANKFPLSDIKAGKMREPEKQQQVSASHSWAARFQMK